MQEVQLWVSRGSCGWTTPLEVEVGGGGSWVGMGAGVGRVCGPTVAPLTPLPVLLVEPLPPPLMVRSG